MAHKILIVEDEKILAEMYKDKFIQAGFEVILVYSSEDALKVLQKEKPDLILLDILLPRTNGIGFLTLIKKDPGLSLIPVIAFSNYDDAETKGEALRLGVKDYLIKTNYTPSEVVAKVKQLLSEG
ncbi:MAG: response regulator [bacterium]|nr:response regulator [bacterium]